MSNALLRRVKALESTGPLMPELSDAVIFRTVCRGDDGVLRDFATGEPVNDGPPVPGVPCGEFRLMTVLGEVA